MTRRDKRRRLSSWLAGFFGTSARVTGGRTPSGLAKSGRRILVEPLEARQLLAGDGLGLLLGSAQEGLGLSTEEFYGSWTLQGEGELNAEGEDAEDLVAFARALSDSGTRFYHAAWCRFCTEQKELFEDGAKFLPAIEVTNPDRSPNEIAIDEGITEYPTWEFPDGTRVTGVQTLQTLAQRSGVAIPLSSSPSFADLPDVQIGSDSPLHVPVDAYDPNGNPLTINVTSSNPAVLNAQVLSGNRSLRLSMKGFGDMVFELFEDRAPVPSGRVIELAEDGFYDGLKFHRVINNFVIQGGDPLGTGTGGSTLGNFDDQYHLDLQHNRTGVLSYAKSADDTNDSQFFITEGPQRFLDFNHSIFGQLVEGELVREAISNTAVVNQGGTPVHDVIINSATIFNDTENGVLLLKPTGIGSSTITVTVTDTEGNSSSKSFLATVVPDTANGAPFLNPIPTIETTVNTPVSVNLTSQDAEGDTVVYSVQALGSQAFGVTVDSATGVATVTPPTGFVGQLQFRATVQQTTPTTTSSATDTQTVRVNVTAVGQPAPSGLDLVAASDSGSSSTDNVTNSQTLTFVVSGTQAGAVVEVRAGGNVVGSATASGVTTEVTVSGVSALGQGATLFTATQRVSSQTSPESPGLSVVLDSTNPVPISAGVIPSSVSVGQNLEVDLAHPEEGQGLTYAVSGAPAGFAINAQNGQISWAPTTAQLGTRSLTLTLTDAAGNATDQVISIDVVEEPQAQVTLNAISLTGQPLTTVAAGETFKVQVIVEDLRPGSSRTGVFAAYVDLLFDPAIIEPVAQNPVNHLAPYRGTPLSGTVSSGLIDELGTYSTSTPQLGPDARVLAEVTFVARASGDALLRVESADLPGNDILLYDEPEAVANSRVAFGSSSFAVGANFVVVDDVFNFDEDSGSHTLNVLANDTVSGGAILTIDSVGTPSDGGTVTIASNGKTLSYTPASNFAGAETFSYTARNQDGVTRTGSVTVQITDVNDPPVALNDTFSVFRNSTQNVLQVLLNDTTGVDDPSSETLMVSAVSAGSAGGTITIGSSGLTLRYTPATDFQGSETFTYTLRDSRGGTANATVTVSVAEQNPPPTAQNDNFTVVEDAAMATFDVLNNDTTSDPGETLSISAVGASNVGSDFSVSSDGQRVNYRPAANFNGQEVLSYTLRDSGGATAIGQVTFTVTPVNDPPNAVDDNLTALSSATTTSLNVLANDLNVDSGEVLTISAVTQPPAGKGTVAISADGKQLVYTSPSNTFEGTLAFTYTINDGTGLTDTATVNLDVRSFVPRSLSGTLSHGSGQTGTLGGIALRLNGTDVTGASVTRETQVASDGKYAFANLAPGNYTLLRDPVPFLNDEGSSIAVQSALNDGNMTTDLIVSGTLKAQYFNIRDFLGSALSNSLTVAIQANGTSQWYAPTGSWETISPLTVTANSNMTSLTLRGVNGNQQNVAATIPINGARTGQVGQDGSTRLLRVWGSTTEVGLAVAPTATNATQASSAASSSSSLAAQTDLVAEGESAGEAPLPAATVVAGAALAEGQLAEGQSLSAANWAESPATGGIQRLLGSSTARRLSSSLTTTPELSSAAVDSAMASVLPALRLQLSGELEDILTSDDDENQSTNDSILADF